MWVCAQSGLFFYEVTIVSKGREGFIGVPAQSAAAATTPAVFEQLVDPSKVPGGALPSVVWSCRCRFLCVRLSARSPAGLGGGLLWLPWR